MRTKICTSWLFVAVERKKVREREREKSHKSGEWWTGVSDAFMVY